MFIVGIRKYINWKEEHEFTYSPQTTSNSMLFLSWFFHVYVIYHKLIPSENNFSQY